MGHVVHLLAFSVFSLPIFPVHHPLFGFVSAVASEGWSLQIPMYAIIRTGGRQFRVEEGRFIDIEKTQHAEGDDVEFNEVLLIENGDQTVIGQPLVEGASVKATVLSQWRDKKVIVYHYRQRTSYRKKTGHRHEYTRVMINQIALS
jgi:large subunit ribosomal protein L21